jgi:hypothetical protein
MPIARLTSSATHISAFGFSRPADLHARGSARAMPAENGSRFRGLASSRGRVRTRWVRRPPAAPAGARRPAGRPARDLADRVARHYGPPPTAIACAWSCGKDADSRRLRWISTTRPVDSKKNLVFTRRRPCATCRCGSRNSLTTDGGPVPGRPRERRGSRETGDFQRRPDTPVAAGRRTGSRVIGSLARPGGAEAPPSHTWRGLRCFWLCQANAGQIPPDITVLAIAALTAIPG